MFNVSALAIDFDGAALGPLLANSGSRGLHTLSLRECHLITSLGGEPALSPQAVTRTSQVAEEILMEDRTRWNLNHAESPVERTVTAASVLIDSPVASKRISADITEPHIIGERSILEPDTQALLHSISEESEDFFTFPSSRVDRGSLQVKGSVDCHARLSITRESGEDSGSFVGSHGGLASIGERGSQKSMSNGSLSNDSNLWSPQPNIPFIPLTCINLSGNLPPNF
jgi:hypothetical protein